MAVVAPDGAARAQEILRAGGMESWVVGAIADPSTARVHRAPVVQGAKGVDGGAVMMVGDYPA